MKFESGDIVRHRNNHKITGIVVFYRTFDLTLCVGINGGCPRMFDDCDWLLLRRQQSVRSVIEEATEVAKEPEESKPWWKCIIDLNPTKSRLSDFEISTLRKFK